MTILNDIRNGVTELDCQECAALSGAMPGEAIALSHDRGRSKLAPAGQAQDTSICPDCPYLAALWRQQDREFSGALN